MAVCGDGIACTGQSYLVRSFGHNAVARFHAGQDLDIFSVVGSYGHFLFLVPFLIQLQIYKVASLFLRQCGAWKGNYVFHWRREQENLYE